MTDYARYMYAAAAAAATIIYSVCYDDSRLSFRFKPLPPYDASGNKTRKLKTREREREGI